MIEHFRAFRCAIGMAIGGLATPLSRAECSRAVAATSSFLLFRDQLICRSIDQVYFGRMRGGGLCHRLRRPRENQIEFFASHSGLPMQGSPSMSSEKRKERRKKKKKQRIVYTIWCEFFPLLFSLFASLFSLI